MPEQFGKLKVPETKPEQIQESAQETPDITALADLLRKFPTEDKLEAIAMVFKLPLEEVLRV